MSSKRIACAHDNASNTCRAMPLLLDSDNAGGANCGVISVSCAGHSINLYIQNSLEEVRAVSTLVSAARRLVGHFRKSELATSALKKKQNEMLAVEKASLKLVQDVPIRCNTVYYMFERLLHLRWPVVAVLSNSEVTKRSDAATLDMTTEQWKLTSEVLPLLQPFELATVLLSSEKSNTAGCVFPFVIGIQNRLSKEPDTDINSPATP